MILPISTNPYTLVHLKVGSVYSLKCFSKISTIKYVKYIPFPYINLLQKFTTINNKQLTFPLFGEVRNTIFYPFKKLLFGKYYGEWKSTHLFWLTILKFNYKIILPNKIFNITHHLFYIAMFIPSYVLSSVSPNFDVTTGPTVIFIFSQFSFFLSLIIG